MPTRRDVRRRVVFGTTSSSPTGTPSHGACPLNRDPDPNDPTDYAREPSTPEEAAEKSKIISETETKIKHWLGRHSKAAGMKENPWSLWLTRFRTPVAPPPRKLPDYQYYMQHEDFKAKVTEAFDQEKAGVSSKDHLNLRTRIARRLLASEPQEVKQRMKDGTEEEHAAQMSKHENALEGLPAIDEEGMEEARARFSGLVGPLLDGLAAHTGYEISLLVGRPKLEEGQLDIECLSMHAGVTANTPAKLDFSRADEAAYAEVMKVFSRFVWGAHEYRKTEGVWPDSSNPKRTSSTPSPPAPTAPTPTAAALTVAAPTVAAPTVAAPTATPPDAAPRSPAAIPAAPALLLSAADLSGLTVPVDTFTDEEIRALVNFDGQTPFDDFNFPDELLSSSSSDAAAFPGLGLPLPNMVAPVLPLDLGPRASSRPYSAEFAAPLSKELDMRLKEMSKDDREAKLGKLKGMDAPSIERENNAARNYYMLHSLGLGNAQKETLWGGTAAPAVKRKASGQRRGRLGKRSRMEKELETHEDVENSGSESETEAEVGKSNSKEKQKENGVRTANGKESSTASTKETASRRAKGATGAWAENADKVLRSKDYGEGWISLLSLWWKREKEAGFEGTTKSHPARLRPKEVGDWVARARNYTPQIANGDEFGKRFWAWWIKINPAWRTEERPMKREGEMSWVGMDILGQNGFLNVLMCLKWWRDAMDAPSPDWEEALNDVTWVLERMSDRMANSSPPTASSSPTPAANTDITARMPNRAGGAPTHTSTQGSHKNEAEVLPGNTPVPKPRALWARDGLNRQTPRESELVDMRAAAHPGTEGLSQEELDEINGDPDADLPEEDE
ncbi:hypothetical protein MSAN_01896700 [Mycena sanguinolenta]|uniref:Uncharacterized protein n=1 Tax=Mycena sanguinolenta TaxID=230812 RepID=A0A8H6XRL6_9AGAR|nr:hypothetical protein MSAN_01896700 [Mycena sanguinolenta]